MKNIFNALLITSALLFTSSAMAGACGMNDDNTQVAITAETCIGSMSVEMLGRQNPDFIKVNPLLKDNEIQKNFNERLSTDEDFKKEVENNVNNLASINTAMRYFLLFCVAIGFLANAFVHPVSGALRADEDKDRYSLMSSVQSYLFLLIFFLIPFGPTQSTGAGLATGYLSILGEKIENYVRRGSMVLFDNYFIERKAGKSVSNNESSTNKNNINVEYSKAESETIVTKMVIAYASMRQTDKAYFAALNSRWAKLADPATFYHYVDNRIEMYRTAPNSAVVDYTGGTHIIPTPNLDFLGDTYNNLNLKQYVTDDIGSLENNLLTAKRVLLEEIGSKNQQSTSVDNVVDVIMLMSKKEILIKYYKQIQSDGTLAAIAKELLKQACYDNMEGEQSKRFLAYYKDGATYEGNPFCLHPTDKTGSNFEVLGLGSTAQDMTGSADRTKQNEWFAKQMALTQEVIDHRHSLLEQIAAIRLSVALTDTTKETMKLATSSQTGFMIAGTEYLLNIEDKQRVIKSLFLGSGEQLISKGSEANLINYEFLSKGGKKSFAESRLRFGYYTQLMYGQFKKSRTAETHSMTTDTVIQNAIETSGSYSELDTTIQKALTNPVTAFYTSLGLTEECRENSNSCIPPTTNVLKNIIELGNNLIDTSLSALIVSTGVSMGSRLTDVFTSSKAEDKGSIKAKTLKSSFTSGINKAAGLFNVVSSLTAYFMTFVFLIGVFFAKVIPLVFNLPLLIAHLVASQVNNILPVVINFFGVWLALANDRDNFQAIKQKLKAVAIVILVVPSLITIIKILSFVSISKFIFIVVEFIYNGTPNDGYTDSAIILFMIAMMLLALVVTVVTMCWNLIGIFFRMIGLQSFFGNEPLKVVHQINNTFSKIIPGVSAVREAFNNEIGRGLRKFGRKK